MVLTELSAIAAAEVALSLAGSVLALVPVSRALKMDCAVADPPVAVAALLAAGGGLGGGPGGGGGGGFCALACFVWSSAVVLVALLLAFSRCR
jgi:hypothetical protein